MKHEKVFLVGIHRYSFRAGEPAEIIGLKMATPDNMLPRLCYQIQFGDGAIDYVACSDSLNFDIISWTQLLKNEIPVVRN